MVKIKASIRIFSTTRLNSPLPEELKQGHKQVKLHIVYIITLLILLFVRSFINTKITVIK